MIKSEEKLKRCEQIQNFIDSMLQNNIKTITEQEFIDKSKEMQEFVQSIMKQIKE